MVLKQDLHSVVSIDPLDIRPFKAKLAGCSMEIFLELQTKN